jgi:malate synthase
MERAVAGAEREQREGANGKWVAHWKMVHIVRPVWEKVGQANQLGRKFPPLTYTPRMPRADAARAGARDHSRRARSAERGAACTATRFLQGFQAAALKPGDFFGNEDVLYLMEDMATGEIRLSILWEWLHKRAQLTDADAETGVKAGDVFSRELFERLLREEYAKLQNASNRDVHDNSKTTTLPVAREIAETYVLDPMKLPWYIDLLNITLGVTDLAEAKRRIVLLRDAFKADGRRITENLDFGAVA